MSVVKFKSQDLRFISRVLGLWCKKEQGDYWLLDTSDKSVVSISPEDYFKSNVPEVNIESVMSDKVVMKDMTVYTDDFQSFGYAYTFNCVNNVFYNRYKQCSNKGIGIELHSLLLDMWLRRTYMDIDFDKMPVMCDYNDEWYLKIMSKYLRLRREYWHEGDACKLMIGSGDFMTIEPCEFEDKYYIMPSIETAALVVRSLPFNDISCLFKDW